MHKCDKCGRRKNLFRMKVSCKIDSVEFVVQGFLCDKHAPDVRNYSECAVRLEKEILNDQD